MAYVRTRAKRKRQEYFRERGLALRMSLEECEDARRHIIYLHDECGMTYHEICQKAGVALGVAANLVRGDGGLLRGSHDRLLAVKPGTELRRYGARVTDAQRAGARRRMRALWAAGFPVVYLADRMPHLNDPAVRLLIHGRTKRMHSSVYDGIVELYEKLKDVDPVDVGVLRSTKLKALASARKSGAEPSSCWDEDTLDDPKAIPEWTGACGTPSGRAVHKREGIPVCRACWRPTDKTFSYGDFDPQRLCERLERLHMTRARLAELAGLSSNTVQTYILATRVPSTRSLERMADVLKLRPEELCFD